MAGKTLRLVLLAYASVASGCTYRAWYEGSQERQRQDCYRNTSQGEIQKCLDRVNGTTYEQYRKGREDESAPAQ